MESVSIEVIVKSPYCLKDKNLIRNACESYLKSHSVSAGTVISNLALHENPFLYENVDHIIIEETENGNSHINLEQVHINWFIYTLNKSGHEIETEYDDHGENIQLASIHILPNAEYFNLWENLIYDFTIKEELLKFAHTALLFADNNIDSNIVNCNRVVLLHGPPGTGKTSLCKALAQKVTVRFNNRFKRGILLEINSHSLFSKWFSESGKLVTKMFFKITEYLKDPESLIFVLIDEIESLTHAREKCMSGVEPSDSIRVVNAVLTQLDQIKRYPNVLILTTSNMTSAIDVAFVDRVDIKKFIGLPSALAIYQIYHSCIQELMKGRIIHPTVSIPSISSFGKMKDFEGTNVFTESKILYKISKLSVGFSGRTLRKMPFIAISLYTELQPVTIQEFFDSMTKAIKKQIVENAQFVNENHLKNGY